MGCQKDAAAQRVRRRRSSAIWMHCIIGLPGPALVGFFAMLPWVAIFFLPKFFN